MSIQDVDRPATSPRSANDEIQSDDIACLSAIELVELYRQKKTSPLDVTRSIINRIERLEPHINAFGLLDAESALASAAESENGGSVVSRWDSWTVFALR